jgi:hypothetical protein
MIMSTVMEKYGFITFPNFRPEFYYGHPPGRYLGHNHPICFASHLRAHNTSSPAEKRERDRPKIGEFTCHRLFPQAKDGSKKSAETSTKNEDQKIIHQLIDEKKSGVDRKK